MDTVNKKSEPRVGIGVMVEKDGKFLLGKRIGSHGTGWSFPGGHLEFNESWEGCSIRETKEETGIEIKNPKFLIATNDLFEHAGRHYITIFLRVEWAKGEPKVMEKDRFEKWEWLRWDEIKKKDNLFLPIVNLIKSGYEPDKMTAEKCLDNWKRCQADFENYKKDQTKAQEEFRNFSNTQLLLEIIPVVDNFEAAMMHIPEDHKESGWVAGVNHIKKQIADILKDNGLEEIETKPGDDFNPEIHEAVAGKGEKHKVTKVIQKGYRLKDRIIRAVRVEVS